MSYLVIVESPAKAATIKGYLGSNYKVIASKGHIRDLPKSTLGVDIEHGFEPHYINISGKGDIIRQLKKEAKGASKIFLATDPDREGEAISWHLAVALGIPLDAKCRVTFNEVTKVAVKEAIKHPRAIDTGLVNSQRARRILDRIVGYKLSPFLWKTVKSGLSAGRVQSVATRIIVEREEEIRAFIPREYWTVDVDLLHTKTDRLTVHYIGSGEGKTKLESGADAAQVVSDIEGKPFTVTLYKHSQKSRQPAPPFITSTMQQEAAKKLNFQSQRTMKVAQELYEGIQLGAELGGVQGLITYMRTDSLRVAEGAQTAALALIAKRYGESYVPKTPRVYRAAKGAQDAHEAIRPADVNLTPDMLQNVLTSDQYKLYKLIWERFIASQMVSAVYDTMTAEFTCAGHNFRATGYSVRFKGFMAAVEVTSEEESVDEAIRMSAFPALKEGDTLTPIDVRKNQNFTESPPRFNDASLIKMLEENGIGRPSTYATIITTIISQSYVKREGKALLPTSLGEITTRLMKDCFADIVDVRFTAQMEDNLDDIEHGGTTCAEVLGEFYTMFERELEGANQDIDKNRVELPPEESIYPCEKCGKMMVYKTGRFGRFLACPSYPTCRNTKAVDKNGVPVKKEEVKPEPAGFTCELCGGKMLVRHGRFGVFYACANYPTCRNTKQKVNEIGVTCPDCGGKVITKFSRGHRLFYGCEKYPDCQFSSWDLPLSEQCPDCGDRLFYKKAKKLVYCRNDKTCHYQREEESQVGDTQ